MTTLIASVIKLETSAPHKHTIQIDIANQGASTLEDTVAVYAHKHDSIQKADEQNVLYDVDCLLGGCALDHAHSIKALV